MSKNLNKSFWNKWISNLTVDRMNRNKYWLSIKVGLVTRSNITILFSSILKMVRNKIILHQEVKRGLRFSVLILDNTIWGGKV